MDRKGYGRTRLSDRLRIELEFCNPAAAIFLGALAALIGLLQKLFSDSPYPVLLALGIGELTPPVWLMVLLWTVALFLVGASLGLVLSCRMCGCDGPKYRAGIFFLLLLVLEYLWYAAFFGAMLVFLSVLLSLLILSCTVATVVLSARVCRLASGMMLLHALWILYLVILNFAVLFRS